MLFFFFLPQLYLFCLITKTQLNPEYKGVKHLIQRTLTVNAVIIHIFQSQKEMACYVRK